jgi:hypothetical protein
MNSIEIDIANYPEIVALTGILVSEHWRNKAMPRLTEQPGWAPNKTRQQFYAEVGRRFKIDYRPHATHDPLVAWVNSTEKSSLLQQAFSPNDNLAQIGWQSRAQWLPSNLSHRSSEPV